MIKIFKLSLLTVLLFGSILLIIVSKSKQNETKTIEAIIIQKNNGWGYNILIKNKIYIHQEFIPAIAGNQPFILKSDAEKVAGLVVQKIKKKEMPTIKTEELDSLRVIYKK